MKTLNLTAPTCWEDLTIRDLSFVVWLRAACLSREERLVAAFCHFTHTKIRSVEDGVIKLKIKKQPFKEAGRLSIEELNSFLPQFTFILDATPENIPNPTRINTHLMDTTFIQYFTADSLFLRYSLQGGRRYVRRAVSALGWHPLWLSNTRCQMVVLWWNSVQRYMKEIYPNVYDDSGAGEICSPFKTHQDIMLLLNDNHPQINASIDASNVHAVLGALNQKISEIKRNEKHQ